LGDFLDSDPSIVEVTANNLHNYPNPFNPSTNISFNLTEPSIVEMTIYNIKGQRIISFGKEHLSAGKHQKLWQGNDDTGSMVSSGLYFIKLEIDGNTIDSKKCLLLK